MTPENFCYWLQGKLELDPTDNRLSEEQVRMIREHLKLVFTEKTNPPYIPSLLGGLGDLGGIKRGPFDPLTVTC